MYTTFQGFAQNYVKYYLLPKEYFVKSRFWGSYIPVFMFLRAKISVSVLTTNHSKTGVHAPP